MSVAQHPPRYCTYPPARQADTKDNYHGTWVTDPYRWLEDPHSDETKAWGAAQNELTHHILNQVPAREQIKQRLTEIWDFPKYGVPFHRGNRYFFTENDGLQNQPILYWQDTLQGKPQVLIDPNTLTEDGTAALMDVAPTPDGSLVAYAISHSGSDWQDIRIRHVETGKDYSETIQWCKFAGIAWHPDQTGFFYNRFPTPDTVSSDQQFQNNSVYWHQLGTSQDKDILVYARPDQPDWGFVPTTTEDGNYILLYVYEGTDSQNRYYYRDLSQPNSEFVKLLDKKDASYSFISNIDNLFYFRTDLNAPHSHIVAIDLNHPDVPSWQEIVPEQEDTIAFAHIINQQLVVVYKHHAQHQVKIFNLDGTYIQDIPLPVIGSLFGVSGRSQDESLFLGFSSFLFPPTIYYYDFKQTSLIPFRVPELDFDASAFQTSQVFLKSKDGTAIPMFLTHKKDLQLDGNNPVILYGYGGFDINLLPQFTLSRTVWLEAGGIFAVVNLRGGGEYGEEWHKQGMLENKQNVFDDYIAAAEWLIDNNYTTSKRLAISGGSNGGLLVAACMLQRPDLYGAVLCHVPVIDMLRYHKFTIGKYWTGEYGNAEENPEHFQFLYAYSPLHNVVEGVTYPPTLITTADTDDRVVPAHAKKFAATLQSKDSGKNPILIRIEMKAGHGQGKPTSKQIEESTDVYAFLWLVFDM